MASTRDWARQAILFAAVAASFSCCRGRQPVLKPGALSRGEIIASTQALPEPHGMRIIIAVLPFQNNTGIAGLDDATSGLTEGLSLGLSRLEFCSIVERMRLEAAFSELGLGYSGAMDPAAAQSVGRLLAANVIVLGSINKLGNRFTLSARLISVETGEIIGGAVVKGDALKRLTGMQDELTRMIVGALKDSVSR